MTSTTRKDAGTGAAPVTTKRTYITTTARKMPGWRHMPCCHCVHCDEDRAMARWEWGPGPWENEPERVEWTHAGLPCRAWREDAWCGAVGVSPGHPLYAARRWWGFPVRAHGGLRSAGPLDDDGLWWLVFDCAGPGDLAPGWDRLLPPDQRGQKGVYRDLAYVTAETNRLAEQLAALVEASR